tara:strand:+ start:40 stop:309 length:270 start_codon:yes stop_codon:yes gene_type:complete
MANKKSAPTKVTKEELENLQEKVGSINNLQMEIGGLEIQKNMAYERLKELQINLNAVQNSLNKKYGTVTVNINDGSLKPMENGQVNKKN